MFYRGWKSNDRHRTCGVRLKTTRIVLPRFNQEYGNNLSWESLQKLGDIDKVFAMLDGKRVPEIGIVDLFNSDFSSLRNGERLSSSYFDIRFYRGAGTIHFFARDKAIVDRLNRLVGRHRQWLPPESERVNEAFWLQYESAEKFDKELRKEVDERSPKFGRFYGDGPLSSMVGSRRDSEVFDRAIQLVNEATDAVLERHGIPVEFQLKDERQSQQLLLLNAA